jgi:DNA/RNA endonuclease G (NUC1)
MRRSFHDAFRHTRTLLAVTSSTLCWSGKVTFAESHAREEVSEISMTDLSPIIPIRIFRPNPNLEIAFDVRTRNPVYVLERLVFDNYGGNNDSKPQRRRRPRFREEASLPEAYRSRNSCYHLSGYDRGHLAPAADFHDPKQFDDTFTLCNVSPQHHVMNRMIWANLEQWTRHLARRAWEQDRATTTYVLSGPLWLPASQVGDNSFQYVVSAIGRPPSLVSVPTHFFKVVAVTKGQQITEFACFCVPNDESSAANNKTLQDWVVRWTDLEAVTGLQFFPSIVCDDWKTTADALTIQVHSATMLLTAGSSQPSSKPKKALLQHPSLHLCRNGQCQPRVR